MSSDLYFQHYKLDSDGLCTKLKRPVPKKYITTEIPEKAFLDGNWVIDFKDLKVNYKDTPFCYITCIWNLMK